MTTETWVCIRALHFKDGGSMEPGAWYEADMDYEHGKCIETRRLPGKAAGRAELRRLRREYPSLNAVPVGELIRLNRT